MFCCPTCLGPIKSGRNLFELHSRKLLDLLQQLLGIQVETKHVMFPVCLRCAEKLLWISEFQDSSRKCYEKISVTKCKKELSDVYQVLEIVLYPDYEYLGSESHSEDSESYNYISQYKIHTKEKAIQNSKDKSVERFSLKKPLKRRPVYQQFSNDEVLTAIAKCTNYMNDVKNKSCLHCNYVASMTKLLKIHMKAKHEDTFETWCSRCNLQTDNLQAHMKATNCFEDTCSFCHRTFKNKIYALTRHLRSHCKSIDVSDSFIDNEEVPVVLSTENTTLNDTYTNCKLEIDSNFKLSEKEESAGSGKMNEMDHHGLNCDIKEELNSDIGQCGATQCENTEVPTKSTLQLFEHEEVLKAVSETRKLNQSYRKCVICGFLSANTNRLNNHMTVKHMDERRKWCRMCNTLEDDLTKHRTDHKKKLLQCRFCDRSYGNISNLHYHLKNHSCLHKSGKQFKWFSCNVCENFYAEEQHLKDHKCSGNIDCAVENEEEKRSILCKRTDSTNPDAAKRRRDNKMDQFPPAEVQTAIDETMKPFQTNIKCIICAAETLNSRMLSTHMTVVHKDVKDTWCNMCNTIADNLRKHKEDHKSDILKCKFCCRSFTELSHLKKHLELHSRLLFDNCGKWYDCDTCPSTYPDEQQLKDRDCPGPDTDYDYGKKIKIIAEGSTMKPCTVCGKKFITEHSLAAHMITHSGKTLYKCSHCDKYCTSKINLIVHERGHTGEKPYVCNVCGKAFAHNPHLDTHMRIHAGRPEECTICHKRFCRPIDLKYHMRRHTGEKRFLCNTCGLPFHQKCNMIDHMRRNHGYGKAFKCRFCDKDFRTHATLKYHEDKHRGIKPFKCNQCSYSCKTPNNFANHMKKHTTLQPLRERRHKCLICDKQFGTKSMLALHMNIRHEEIV